MPASVAGQIVNSGLTTACANPETRCARRLTSQCQTVFSPVRIVRPLCIAVTYVTLTIGRSVSFRRRTDRPTAEGVRVPGTCCDDLRFPNQDVRTSARHLLVDDHFWHRCSS